MAILISQILYRRNEFPQLRGIWPETADRAWGNRPPQFWFGWSFLRHEGLVARLLRLNVSTAYNGPREVWGYGTEY